MRLVLADVDYVKHYGVKGQQWGVRRKNLSTSDASKQELTTQMQRSGKTIFVGLGAAYALKYFADHNPRLGVALGLSTASGVVVHKLIQKNRNKKMSEITP